MKAEVFSPFRLEKFVAFASSPLSGVFAKCNKAGLLVKSIPHIQKSGYTSRVQKINKFVSGEISAYHDSLSKKCFDFTLTSVVIILLSPTVGLISLPLKLTSEDLAFFKQKRIRKNGKLFTLIKLRTMRMGAEQEQKTYQSRGARIFMQTLYLLFKLIIRE